MVWRTQDQNLPYMPKYKDVVKHFETQTARPVHKRPHKVWGSNCVPLKDHKRNRDYQMMQLRKEGDVFTAFNSDHPVVRWRADGVVDIDCRGHFYDCKIVENCLSISFVPWYEGQMFYRIGNSYYSVKTNRFMKLDADGQPIDPKPFKFTKELADREVRHRIKLDTIEFFNWFDAVTKVGNGLHGVVSGAQLESSTPPTWEDVVTDAVVMKESDRQAWINFCFDVRICAGSVAPYICSLLFTEGAACRHWDAISKPHYIKPLRDKILEVAYRAWGGYRYEECVTPAGEMPVGRPHSIG